jgi:hypothetical protein
MPLSESYRQLAAEHPGQVLFKPIWHDAWLARGDAYQGKAASSIFLPLQAVRSNPVRHKITVSLDRLVVPLHRDAQ